jgi:hypothetical protein
MNRYHEKLPEKVRKNAVLAVELVMTASPEFSGDWDQYLKNCDQWAGELFGKENLLHIAHHKDEKTPHTHIIFMPMKDGKLNAKHFIGGSRDRMAELQDDFFQKVGRPAGLERGQSRAETRARHTPHTLAAAAAEVEEEKEKLVAVSKEVIKTHGMHPVEIRDMKARLARLDSQTPSSLRSWASTIEAKGFATVGDYRKAVEERQQQQTQKRGIKR